MRTTRSAAKKAATLEEPKDVAIAPKDPSKATKEAKGDASISKAGEPRPAVGSNKSRLPPYSKPVKTLTQIVFGYEWELFNNAHSKNPDWTIEECLREVRKETSALTPEEIGERVKKREAEIAPLADLCRAQLRAARVTRDREKVERGKAREREKIEQEEIARGFSELLISENMV